MSYKVRSAKWVLISIQIFLIDRLKFKLISEANTTTYFYDYLVMNAGNILKKSLPFNVIF